MIGSQAKAKLQTCPATVLRGPKREEELRGSQLNRGHRPAFSFQESLGGPQLFTTPLPRSQDSAFSLQCLQGWLRSHSPGAPTSLIPLEVHQRGARLMPAKTPRLGLLGTPFFISDPGEVSFIFLSPHFLLPPS